jgi:hypothetical protein
MPTGYTSGIIDGDIKTFKEFATGCMRAFGATIHMRDDSMDAEYKPRVIDDYYIRAIKEYEDSMEELNKMSDSEIISNETKNIKKDIKYYEDVIVKRKKTAETLNEMLKEVLKWNPPTSEHIGFKDFMKEQLESTIRYDGDFEYYKDTLSELKEKLTKPVDALYLRNFKLSLVKESLDRAKERLVEEVNRCSESNNWVEVLMKSI